MIADEAKIMQRYNLRTTLFLLLYVTKGSWNVENRTFRVSYEKTRITFECVVSPLNSRLTFELNGTEVGVCSPPIPQYSNGTCTSDIGEITQNILKEKTTLTFQYSALDKINGIWECCHATGKDSCITKPVKIPFYPDTAFDETKQALMAIILAGTILSLLGFIICMTNYVAKKMKKRTIYTQQIPEEMYHNIENSKTSINTGGGLGHRRRLSSLSVTETFD